MTLNANVSYLFDADYFFGLGVSLTRPYSRYRVRQVLVLIVHVYIKKNNKMLCLKISTKQNHVTVD